MSVKIKPLGNRVLVQISKKSQTSKSGIILATEQKEENSKGTVIAVGVGFGDEKELLKEIKVGDTVIFSSYAGQEFKGDSEDDAYKLVPVKDIAGVEEK